MIVVIFKIIVIVLLLEKSGVNRNKLLFDEF